jgi:hypothetical protein
VSIPVQSPKNATILTIALILAIARWPNNQNLTSVLNATIALQRTWYVLSKFQEKRSSRRCKAPQNHHHFHHHHNRFCPPCRCRKKLTLIAPPNNDECLGERMLPLNLTFHQHNTRPRNRHPQGPWPDLGDKFGTRICPTGGQTVLYGSSTWWMGNFETFPLELSNPPIPYFISGAHLGSTCLSQLH